MNLVEAREAIAAALSQVEDLHVRARGPVRSPRQGDGWVTVARLAPADFTRSTVTLVAVVVLGADDVLAEELLDTWAVGLIDAVSGGEIPVADVALEPVLLPVDGGGALHACTITLIMEVDP